MKNANVEDIRILNGLIGATMESARHYGKAAGRINNPSIRALFERRATERKRITQALRDQVRVLSGNPQAESGEASTHRVFGNLRHAMSFGYCALIDEVERGEEHVKARYECALADGRLSPLSQTVVRNVYASIREGYEEMNTLKRYPGVGALRSEGITQW